jgi:hypothetical protein
MRDLGEDTEPVARVFVLQNNGSVLPVDEEDRVWRDPLGRFDRYQLAVYMAVCDVTDGEGVDDTRPNDWDSVRKAASTLLDTGRDLRDLVVSVNEDEELAAKRMAATLEDPRVVKLLRDMRVKYTSSVITDEPPMDLKALAERVAVLERQQRAREYRCEHERQSTDLTGLMISGVWHCNDCGAVLWPPSKTA